MKNASNLHRRQFVKLGTLAASAGFLPAAASAQDAAATYTLPKLPYAFDALEPHIDAKTMEIHHGKHHAAYINNLNTALASKPELAKKPLDELLAGLPDVSDEALLEYYRTVGVAVAPMRFGAGMKGKVIEALHHGLPLVTTPVGAQGLEAVEQIIPVSFDANVIADAIVRLMEDDDYWQAVAAGGREYANARFSRAALRRVFLQDMTP